jgi:hypothetical protein
MDFDKLVVNTRADLESFRGKLPALTFHRQSIYVCVGKYKISCVSIDWYRDDYSVDGVIIPQPPEKSSLAAVAVKVSANADLNESVASKIISKRCVALDR